MSGRAIAAALGKSEKYVRERLNDALSFTLNDVESFAVHIGYSAEEFVTRVERDLEPSNVTQLRPNVPDSDDDELDAVARPIDNEPTDEQ